jgi:hypothetical protein
MGNKKSRRCCVGCGGGPTRWSDDRVKQTTELAPANLRGPVPVAEP